MLLSRKNRNHSQLDHNISKRDLRYQLRGLLMERINSNFMVYIWVSLKLKRNCFHKASCCSKLNFRTWKTNCLTFPIISLIRLKNKQNTILKSKSLERKKSILWQKCSWAICTFPYFYQQGSCWRLIMHYTFICGANLYNNWSVEITVMRQKFKNKERRCTFGASCTPGITVRSNGVYHKHLNCLRKAWQNA